MNLAVYSVFYSFLITSMKTKISIHFEHVSEKELIQYMKIENKTMLHISRKTNWKIGDKIIAGEKENTFWNSYRNYSPVVKVNEQKMPLFEMFTRLPSRHKCIWLTDNENLA